MTLLVVLTTSGYRRNRLRGRRHANFRCGSWDDGSPLRRLDGGTNLNLLQFTLELLEVFGLLLHFFCVNRARGGCGGSGSFSRRGLHREKKETKNCEFHTGYSIAHLRVFVNPEPKPSLVRGMAKKASEI